MKHPDRRRADPFENLLEGRVADGSPLATVLSAARAPGTAAEIAGLDAALSAFYRLGPATRPFALVHAPPNPPHRWLALKVAATASALSLAGGVAYAATGADFLTGGSPRPPGTHSTRPDPRPAWAPLAAVPSGSDESQGVRPSHHPRSGRPALPAGPAKTAAATHSAHPTHPTHPTHPAHPSHPTHPAKPSTRSGHPSHPTHPSHPAKKSDAIG